MRRKVLHAAKRLGLDLGEQETISGTPGIQHPAPRMVRISPTSYTRTRKAMPLMGWSTEFLTPLFPKHVLEKQPAQSSLGWDAEGDPAQSPGISRPPATQEQGDSCTPHGAHSQVPGWAPLLWHTFESYTVRTRSKPRAGEGAF